MFKFPWDSLEPNSGRDELGDDALAELVELESQRKLTEDPLSAHEAEKRLDASSRCAEKASGSSATRRPSSLLSTGPQSQSEAHTATRRSEMAPATCVGDEKTKRGPIASAAPPSRHERAPGVTPNGLSNKTVRQPEEKPAKTEPGEVDGIAAVSTESGVSRRSHGERSATSAESAPVPAAETCLGQSAQAEMVEAEAASVNRKVDAIDICIHRREDGGWVISPLHDHDSLELRNEGSEIKGPHAIWRLDDQVFSSTRQPEPECADAEQVTEKYLKVAKKLKRTTAEVKQLQEATAALQVAFKNFEGDKLAFEHEKRRLHREMDEKRKDLAKQQKKTKENRKKLDAERRKLDKDDQQFRCDADEAGQFLAAALQTSVFCPSGEVAVPAEAFFVAAQGEFVRSVPALTEPHRLQMQILKAAPSVELLRAKEAFVDDSKSSSEDLLERRVEALAQAFMIAQCMDVSQKPSNHQGTLENLAKMASTLSHFANKAGRLPLAFAASCCAVWCAFHLTDSLSALWTEVSSASLVKDLEAAEELGYLDKHDISRTAKQLVSHGEGLRRIQRYWNEHGDHRRRFIRFFAKCTTGKDPSTDASMPSAVEADLRLLILPHSATPAELAMQLQRVRSLVDTNASEKRQKRKRGCNVGEAMDL